MMHKYHTSQVFFSMGMVAIEAEAEVGFFKFAVAVAVVHHVNGGTVESKYSR